MKPNRIVPALAVLLIFFLATTGNVRGSDDPFPMPDVIAANVDFWTQVYARYGSDQGIVHDSIRMNVIYDTIALLPYDAPGAGKVNRARMKAAREKFRRILERLAATPHTTDKACRRVAALFDDPHDAGQFRLAAGRVRCQIGQKDRFQAGLIRSGAYLDRIRTILTTHDLPADLAYLPHVESSFNPNAYSKYGAAGMWQFTRSTGKRFMEVGYTLDERRDPILAAAAAAQLLKENYEKLGSWPLALTAYNHGAAGMERAKRLHGEFENVFKHYRSRSFKFASRNFYAEFLAARHVAANYRNYFGELQLDRPDPTRVLIMEGYVAFDALCEHFGVSPRELSRLNPALRQPVLTGQKYVPKGYALRLPPASAATAISTATLPDNIFSREQKPSRFYTVQRGDTASRIARIHGVRLDDLIVANHLDRRATIYPHQTLRIPGQAEQRPKPSTPVVETPAMVATASPPASTGGDHSSGDPMQKQPPEPSRYPQPVLASVIPLTSEADGADSDHQALADRLARNGEIVTVDVAIERIDRFKGQLIGMIQVEVEETLGHYAEWAGVPARQIRRLNGLTYGEVLRLHQRIRIPLDQTNAETFEQNRYEHHKRLQEDFYAVYRIGELKSYRVQRGDSLWTLCREKFGVPMWLLKHCNPDVDLADLKFQQELMVPSIERLSTTDAEPGVDQEDEEMGATQPDQV